MHEPQTQGPTVLGGGAWKAPFIVSLPLSPVGKGDHPSGLLMRRAGFNTGNLLFTHALPRVLDYEELAHGLTFDPAEVAERHDCIVVPAANWLQPRHDFADLAAKIEATELPCVIVGIGAQASLRGGIPDLQDGVIRLLKIASERSYGISARGEHSAEVLAHHGIENVTVTGCPSLLWHVTGPRRVEKPDRQIDCVVLNSSRGAPSEGFLTSPRPTHRLSLLLSRVALERGLDFVAQAELPDIPYALGEVAHDPYAERFPDLMTRIWGTGDSARLDNFHARHVKVFFEVQAWLDYLGRQDFVFGTRLHGAIAALLAGTPAALIAHDSRTTEMAREAAIPTVAAEAVTEDVDFQAIYDACDVEAFNRRATTYYARFAAFLEASGLRHRLGRVDPASAPL